MTAHAALTDHASMEASPRRASDIRLDTTAWPIPSLIDRALATYVDWRETADAVTDTYRRWCAAPATEEATRFAAHMTALDQEQTAAGMCAESISEFERWLPDWDPDRGSEPRAAPG
jgi:hypothetical protein